MEDTSDKPSRKENKLWKTACAETIRLKDDPNIVKVGYGIKFVKGKPTFKICIRYFVRKKLVDEKDIKKFHTKPIPKEVNGIPTDVIEYVIPKPLSCPEDNGSPVGDRGSRQEDPLVGGTSSTVLSSSFHSFPTGYGTLGGICFDDSTGDAMALSNAHVWGEDVGDDVIQPWLPTDEYLEGLVKILACGPYAFLLDGTMPSPLTAALTAAAAGAWIAAAASDDEDPNRWGQRKTDPPSNSKTINEKINIKTKVPEFPFAGYPYTTDVSWKYSRITDNGNFNVEKTEKQVNRHVLLEKKVWTEKSNYYPGDQVRICGEIATNTTSNPEDYFVVAHCYPTKNPDRVIPRILTPGNCKVPGDKIEVCFHGFDSVGKPGDDIIGFPFSIGDFEFFGKYAWLRGPFPDIVGDNSTVLEFSNTLVISFPDCSEVELDIFLTSYWVRFYALNEDGVIIDKQDSTGEQNKLQKIKLSGPNIRSVFCSADGAGAHIVGACITRKVESKRFEKENRFQYSGTLDLPVSEPKDKWNVVLFVQTVDNSPPGTKPEVAAQRLGGITTSANIGSAAICTGVMILDHVFDVI